MICDQCHDRHCTNHGGHRCLKIQLRAANARAKKAEAECDANGCHVCGHIDCPLPAAESARIATDPDACAKWLAALADCATRSPVDWRGGYFAATARAERAEAERDEARERLRLSEDERHAHAGRAHTALQRIEAERDAAVTRADRLLRAAIARDAVRAARRIALARVAPHALAVRAVHLALGLVLLGRRPESVDARAVVEGAAGMVGR